MTLTPRCCGLGVVIDAPSSRYG